MVDNCYGEFVETHRAHRCGSGYDCVGSLIKNPGGGLAPVGGYIVGKEHCMEQAAYRLTSPGLGKEVGATPGRQSVLLPGPFPGSDCDSQRR